MTRDDRDPGPRPDDPQAPRREVPSWVDEVLSAPPAPSPAAPTPAPQVTVASVDPAPAPLSGPDDLRIPERGPAGAAPQAQPLTPPAHDPARPTLLDSADDWIARATGGTAPTPSMPNTPPLSSEPVTHAPASRPADPWAMGAPPTQYASGPIPSDIATRRLIAGLLGIVLGAFGVHKLYLGITTPGLIMLGVNVGVWIVALLLGLLLFIVGVVVTLPIAGLISGAVGLLGLVEGILYLTKSDEDFYREYVVGKKPWL
ncbi:TM2 domain-containing membrane protein YozV [Deinococcus sp. HSC-46F16]|uniref:TM2 domain-containing protein n=1 Tax=Deinococcus sp. HSC-46F16 TaxID=2910968 RepID=UPI00209FB94C|nr:NINE protein [Deinococcus sp. HSC-46F16]MCP2014251.1 TM2 domain-containing membrane protein YozV [Deinococcus sp. HSC-46F16]